MDSDIKVQAEIHHFDLPLRSLLRINRENISRRQGFILILSTPDGQSGFGEISPLPGLHPETAYDAGKQLQQLCLQLPDLNQIIESVKNESILPDTALYPSVRFGFESAIIDLLAQRENVAPSQVLNSKDPYKKIKVNGLITRDENVPEQIEYFLKMGYETIKIKLGNHPVAEEINKIRNVDKLIDKNIKLRIDANRSWSLVQAEAFFNQIHSRAIEYVEEPLREAEKLPDLFVSTGMPIALDESIQMFDESESPPKWCAAIILKPALLGSIFNTYNLIQKAADHGIISVISDTFQAGIGMTMLVNLSSLANGDKIAMGLNTLRWLDDDLLKNRIQINDGEIDLSQVNLDRHDMDFSKLDKIL